jgi:DNA polymerase III sliding clamp (beta) subunit (PCNA family)
MLSNDLARLIAPYKQMINKGALSPTYRVLKLQGWSIIGASNYAVLEVDAELLLDPPVCVDAANFIAIISSLPDNQEVELSAEDGVLAWKCGQAKGRLAIMPEVKLMGIDRKPARGGWVPTPPFREALDLGSISAGNDSFASAGMAGIVIDNREKLRVYACDGATISDAIVLDDPLPGCPATVTVSPPGAELLHTLLRDKKAVVEFDAKSIFASGADFKCLIKQVAPLKNDIAKMLAIYQDAEVVAEIPSDRIAAFIRRVGALSEKKREVHVTIAASKGMMTMAFLEGAASADEYYLVDGLNIPDLPEVLVDAGRMARALVHCTEIVLDHAERGILILRGIGEHQNDAGEVCEFSYLISGRK